MKKFFIILSVAIAVIAVAFAGYRFWELNQDVAVAEIIPPGAMVKLESSDFYSELQDIRNSKQCNSLGQIFFIKELGNRFELLDSLMGKNLLKTLLTKKTINAVFYDTEDGAYDFLLFIPVLGQQDKTILDKVLAKTPSTTYTIEKRSLYGIEINEIKKGGNQFCFVKFRNYIVSSSSPLLIENFIRHVSEIQNWFTIRTPPAEVVAKTGKTSFTVTLYYHQL